MPKCHVTTNSGEHVEVEADGYELLRDSGFVILKRRIVANGQQKAETTAAIFYRPDKVLLPTDDGGVTSG